MSPKGDSPKPVKPRSRSSIGAVRSPESTEAILDAAAAILEERGYRAFTMDALVERAGSSKPTIYRWWRSKGALLRDVYQHTARTLVTSPNTGDMERDLVVHLRSLWTWWRSTSAGETLRSLIAEVQTDPAAIEAFRKDFLPRREQTMREIFSRAVESGELEEHAPVEVAISMLTGMSWLRVITADLDNLDDVDKAVRTVLIGLGRKVA